MAGVVQNRRRERLAWTIAAIAGLALVALGAWSLRRPTPDVRTHVSSALPPPGVSLETAEAPAISPDGRRLLFVGHDPTGKQLLYALALDVTGPAQPLAHTDGASLPFWSPDSHSVRFFGQGKLKTVDIETGQIRTLADAGGARGGTWNRTTSILFAPRPATGLYRISAAGGQATPVKIENGGSRFPSFLPDGRHFLFFRAAAARPENAGVFVASLNSSRRVGWSLLDLVRFMPPDTFSFGGKVRCWRRRSTKQPSSTRESRSGRQRSRTQSGHEPGAVFGIGLRHARVLRGRRR